LTRYGGSHLRMTIHQYVLRKKVRPAFGEGRPLTIPVWGRGGVGT
jgi:hypothetical protein